MEVVYKSKLIYGEDIAWMSTREHMFGVRLRQMMHRKRASLMMEMMSVSAEGFGYYHDLKQRLRGANARYCLTHETDFITKHST